MVVALVIAQVFQLHGFVDTYYALNSNRPDDRVNFASGAGTSAQFASEFRVNLAAIDLVVEPKPVGFHLALGWGTGLDTLHAAEPFLGPLVQAFASFKASSLTIDAGLFNSHVGLDELYSKDNWNYTRAWMSELSPYYQAGVRATWAFDDHWSAQLHLLNGWQTAGDVNRAKTIGTQVQYSGDRVTAAFNTLIGPELPNDDSTIRWFGDLVCTVKISDQLSVAATADGALQGSARWAAAAALARYAFGRFAVAARAELFDDDDGAISGAAQALHAATLTLEWKPVEALLLRLEGRHDRSTAAVFHTGNRTETLAIASAVASF